MNFVLIMFRRRRHRRRLRDCKVYACFVSRTTYDVEALTHLLMSDFIKTFYVNGVNIMRCGDMNMW